MAYARRALCFEQWPTGDQAAVTAARVKADPLDDPGLAAHWRPKTVHTVMTHYGLWLAYLMESGQLDPSVPPAARAARANLAGYLADLRARGLASITIAGRFRDLREALRVMQPGADLSALDHLTPRLEAVAEPSRAKRLAVVLPVLLLNAAIAEMTRTAICPATSRQPADGRALPRRTDCRLSRDQTCAAREPGSHHSRSASDES